MNIKPYKQTTYETCLPSCLIMLLDIKNGAGEEIKIWERGWKFERRYCTYVAGPLNYVARRWKRNFKLFIEKRGDYYVNKKLVSPRIKITNRKVDLALIKENLKFGPAILYVDSYYLPKYINKAYHFPPKYIKSFYHYPHFILVTGIKKKVKIVDPFDGRIKCVKKKTIKEGISSLRRRLGFSPLLIGS